MAAGLPEMPKISCTVCEASAGCFLFPFTVQSDPSSLVRHQFYSKGEAVFEQGAVISGLYVLCDGKVTLVRCTRDGRRQIVKFLNNGNLFGESSLSELRVTSVSARALADSVVGWLSLRDFQELLKRFPDLALALQKKLADEIEALRVRLTELAYLGTRERLIKLILELGEKYGRRSDSGLVVDLELTERELAEMLGNRPEWMCKQLRILWMQGLVVYRRGELVILDEAGLRQRVTPRERQVPFWSGKQRLN